MSPSDKLEIVAAFVDETAGPLSALTARLEALTAKVDELNGTMSKTGSSMSDSVGKSSSALDGFKSKLDTFGSAAKGIGTQLSTYVTAPIVGIAFAAGKMAMDFQQQMEILHTEAGVPQSALASLGASIEDLAGKVGFSPTSLAEAMYHIESNGKGLLTASQAMDQLKVSAEAAAMTGASLDDTTYTLSSTLASGIQGAKGYADMMGVLNGIVGAGDMKFQDLNGAISTGFMATAAQFGISVQSIGAALATLTDNGEGAEEAATRLRMSVTLMSAPSSQAAKVLGALGLSGKEVKAATQAATDELAAAHVTTTQLADDLRKPDGVNVALMDLQTHLEKSGLSADAADAAIAKAFGGGRSDAAILTLLHNTKRTGEAFDSINKNETNFNKDWQAQQQTAKQKFEDAWGSIRADLTKLGTKELPGASKAFQDLAGKVNDLTNWFINLSPHHQEMLVKFAAYAALIGPALLILGQVASSLSNIITLMKFVGGPAIQLMQGAMIGGLRAIGVETTGLQGLVFALQTTIASPVALAISIAAALAAIAYVMQKVQETRDAIDGAQKASQNLNAMDAQILAKAKATTDPKKRAALLKIYNMPEPDQTMSTSQEFWANLGHFANGGVVSKPMLATVAETGPEAIIPLNNPGRARQVMNEAGLSSGTSGGSPGVYIDKVVNNTNADWESMMRDLAWRLASAN